MSNDNFSSSTPSPTPPRQEPGLSHSEADPVIFPNDQYLSEHVEQGLATGTGTPHADQESNLAKAKEMSKDLAAEGQYSMAEVTDTAKQEAAMLAEQAKEQASHLFEELSADMREQTSLQQRKVAENLRDISNEFLSMLDQSQASGTAATLVDQASHHSGRVADWLDQREPGDLVNEVKDFARKRPGAFLGIALGAGLLAGRITRNASGSDSQDQGAAGSDLSGATGARPDRDYRNPDRVDTPPPVVPRTAGLASDQTPQTASTEDAANTDPISKYPGLDPRTEDYR